MHQLFRMRQQAFIPKCKLSFGGALLKKNTNPKSARPLDSKLPIHLVLRSEHARMRLPKTFHSVNKIFEDVAAKWGVRIYEYANAGNHLHALLKISRRFHWAGFIRELTGRIARLTKSKWEHRPFTRVVSGWKRAFKIVREYIKLNEWETSHRLSRKQSEQMRDLMREMGFEDPVAGPG